MKNSINSPNLDINWKKIDCTSRWYASNWFKSYYFFKDLEWKWVAFFLKHLVLTKIYQHWHLLHQNLNQSLKERLHSWRMGWERTLNLLSETFTTYLSRNWLSYSMFHREQKRCFSKTVFVLKWSVKWGEKVHNIYRFIAVLTMIICLPIWKQRNGT